MAGDGPWVISTYVPGCVPIDSETLIMGVYNTVIAKPLSASLITASIIAAGSLGAPAAQAFTLDFESPDINVGLGNSYKGDKVKTDSGSNLKDEDGHQVWTGDGDLISDQWADQGVIIYEASGQELLLFNSNCGDGYDIACSGGDNDLGTGEAYGTVAQGNVLIIQEDSKLYDPDDDRHGGSIIFDFDELVSLTEIQLLDVDDGNPDLKGVEFEAFFADGTSTVYTTSDVEYTLLSPEAGDNSHFSFDLTGINDVSAFAVNYSGSGAIASLTWESANLGEEESREIPEPTTLLGTLLVGTLGLTRRRSLLNLAKLAQRS